MNITQFITFAYSVGSAHIEQLEHDVTWRVMADRKGEGGGMQTAVTGVSRDIAIWVADTINQQG